MDVNALRLLYDNVHDFKTTATLVEADIGRWGIRHDSDEPVPGAKGRRHREMWVSMKSVSHFNVGIAIELLLKMLLILKGIEYKKNHSLVELHDLIPARCQSQLQTVYADVKRPVGGCELVAFINWDTEDSDDLPVLENRDVDTVRGIFEYLDHDLMVSKSDIHGS
ncbi:MAG: HEPN domain-containing protein [Chloroflexi bacterium]|nr:HEPN domain-containing protein [Chloroflexota bacterium]MYE32163.1 HEPN domain-containing protein [Chloroflexota bacterium]